MRYIFYIPAGGSLTMRSGEVVPVSQGRRKEAKERFAKFLASSVI